VKFISLKVYFTKRIELEENEGTTGSFFYFLFSEVPLTLFVLLNVEL